MKHHPREPASEKRNHERTEPALKTIVQLRENNGDVSKEVTEVKIFSRNGASFSLTRACKVGQLVMLVMALPREYRAYDQHEELYAVIGIVQNCYKAKSAGQVIHHISVGFIGKHAPESFEADPRQNYRICGMRPDGLWQVVETDAQFKRRKHFRFGHALQVTISLIQKEKKSVSKEDTITKDICATGASVYCTLNAKPGDRVKFASKEHDFYALAIVRNRQESKIHPPTLHLEFIENEFPVERLSQAKPAAMQNLKGSSFAARTDPGAESDVMPPPETKSQEVGQFEFRQY